MPYDEKAAARIRKLLSGRRDVAEKKMIGGLAFMVGGAMCCSASGRGGLLVRVQPEARARYLEEPHVHPAVMGARTMQGFLRVDPAGYASATQLEKWVDRGLEAAADAPAKPKKARTQRKRARR